LSRYCILHTSIKLRCEFLIYCSTETEMFSVYAGNAQSLKVRWQTVPHTLRAGKLRYSTELWYWWSLYCDTHLQALTRLC